MNKIKNKKLRKDQVQILIRRKKVSRKSKRANKKRKKKKRKKVRKKSQLNQTKWVCKRKEKKKPIYLLTDSTKKRVSLKDLARVSKELQKLSQ
jgi:hypothetical protein